MAMTFNVETVAGLSDSIAAQRLREEGYNELPSSKQRTRAGHRPGSGPGAHVPHARGVRRAVHADGRIERRPDALGLRLRGHGHHHRPGATNRTCLGGAQGPFQPTGACDSRRTTEADCRTRRGARRHDPLGRRGPRPGRRNPSSRDQSLGRRILAHGGIRPGAESPFRRGRPSWDRPAATTCRFCSPGLSSPAVKDLPRSTGPDCVRNSARSARRFRPWSRSRLFSRRRPAGSFATWPSSAWPSAASWWSPMV